MSERHKSDRHKSERHKSDRHSPDRHSPDPHSSDRHTPQTAVRTTGILQNNLGVAINVHLELLNLNPNAVEVRAQVLNWGDAVTQTNPVSTLLDVTQNLAGNTRLALNATVAASLHYEVRLFVSYTRENREDQNVLINTYARTAIGGGQVAGLSVLNSEFTTVQLNSCF